MRPFTSADDVGGFQAARGILTSQGGKSSHAAIVARGMGRPCVCGASELEIDLERPEWDRRRVLQAGDSIAIDGSTGVVTADKVELIEPRLGEASTRCSLGRRDAETGRAGQRGHRRGRRSRARAGR